MPKKIRREQHTHPQFAAAPGGELPLQIAAKHNLFRKGGERAEQYPCGDFTHCGRREAEQRVNGILLRGIRLAVGRKGPMMRWRRPLLPRKSPAMQEQKASRSRKLRQRQDRRRHPASPASSSPINDRKRSPPQPQAEPDPGQHRQLGGRGEGIGLQSVDMCTHGSRRSALRRQRKAEQCRRRGLPCATMARSAVAARPRTHNRVHRASPLQTVRFLFASAFLSQSNSRMTCAGRISTR